MSQAIVPFTNSAAHTRRVYQCVSSMWASLLCRRPTNNTAPRSYQDERFSYVVLKRGPRPRAVEASIAEVPMANGPIPGTEHGTASVDPSTESQQEVGTAAEGQVDDSDAEAEDLDLSLLDPATRELVLESMASGSDSDDASSGASTDDDDDDDDSDSDSYSDSDDEDHDDDDMPRGELASSNVPSNPAASERHSHTSSSSANALPERGQTSSPYASRQISMQRHQSDQSATFPEAKVGTQSSRVNPTAASDVTPLSQASRRPNHDQPTSTDGERPIKADTGAQAASEGDAEAALEAGTEAEDELLLDEADLEAALAASRSWSRVVRKPRTRHRHVILDVCAAKRTPGGQVAGEGQLLQQVVGKADIAWAGPKGYRIARKTRWGDLWPTFFQDQAIVVHQREPANIQKVPKSKSH